MSGALPQLDTLSEFHRRASMRYALLTISMSTLLIVQMIYVDTVR